ncbi:hypothetical protein [Solirubrobacter deserti]|uniref:ESX secretion-associated protein EspG n=1 Tax=Solirubrobacter deserti TaxID=2282478 RepID=A0ABT4RGB2_9ACTN|nr:hypothetical protein [Solirubrobacter deserti]MDA0137580.1 hypothetical protein [Solirubrobacter deserti]
MIEFEEAHGDLRARVEVIDWVLGERDAPPEDAGVLLVDGALHPRLQAAREIVRAPLAELWMERGDRRGRGWVSPRGSVLAHPLPDGRMRLVTVRTPLVIDALVRLNDVGPRPRFEPAIRIAVAPAALAEALAAREAVRAGIADPQQAAAFERVVAGLREHWRVSATWEPADGALGGRDIEVLDTEDGYWLVIPDDPTVELWPATPTAVFRGLCGLLPTFEEVRS